MEIMVMEDDFVDGDDGDDTYSFARASMSKSSFVYFSLSRTAVITFWMLYSL